MRTWAVALCCWLSLGRADAQAAAALLSARSSSGQFTALAPPQSDAPGLNSPRPGVPGRFSLNPAPNSNIPLDPSLLVMSCENIKQSLLLTLGWRDQWQGGITLFIRPGLPPDQSPVLEGVYDPKGWNYRLILPSPIEPRLLIRAVVNALLMETANRRAGVQSAEVPFWLVAGLGARMKADAHAVLLLRPYSQIAMDQVSDPRTDPLRAQLRRESPLTFQQLCWPEPGNLAGTNDDLYSACAQLFVDQLLRLKDGNRCLAAMIDELPRHLNWQTSFLEAFSAHFRRLLDVEKWWELACVNFTDADYASRLSPADSWLLLQQALDVPVQVHFSANNLPAPAQIPLQEVINTWQPAQAGEALQRVADKLARLRPRITPDLQPLLDRYVAAVRSFLNDSRTGQRPGLARNPVSQLAFARTAACQDLNALDAQRAVLRSRYVVAPGQPRLSAAVPADKQ